MTSLLGARHSSGASFMLLWTASVPLAHHHERTGSFGFVQDKRPRSGSYDAPLEWRAPGDDNAPATALNDKGRLLAAFAFARSAGAVGLA